ncbi:hypothetical protein BC834DRAFT_899167 [Gloeopeniophorella convolvens]|nr:hypothetical protein BC834DRAFT_899167 [Gloeopeniophorella convolvens]
MPSHPSAAAQKDAIATLALRITFEGLAGTRVLSSGRKRVQSLAPWLRTVLTSLGLPHPKTTNIVRPDIDLGALDVFWDFGTANDQIVRSVVSACSQVDPEALREQSVIFLGVYIIPSEQRKILPKQRPFVENRSPPPGDSVPSNTDSSHLSAEAALMDALEGYGLPHRDFASSLPTILAHVQTLRVELEEQIAARTRVEAQLARERMRHTQALQDIQAECREPFVVPALLDAFLSLSQAAEDALRPLAD